MKKAKTSKREAPKRIILTLGKEAKPLTVYAITKNTPYTEQAIYESIKKEKGLEFLNMVWRYSEEDWPARGKEIKYFLTFRGLIEYLDLVFNDPKMGIPEIKKVIQGYNKSSKGRHVYPLLEHSEFLAKNGMGDAVYEAYMITSFSLKKSPPKTWIHTQKTRGDLPGILEWLEKEKKRQKFRIVPPEEEDEIWMYAFTLFFLQLTEKDMKEKIKRAKNEALWRYIEKTLREDTKVQEDRLKEVQRMKTTFEDIFSSAPPSLRRK